VSKEKTPGYLGYIGDEIPFLGGSSKQSIYGNFEGIPENKSALFGLVS